uniref:AAA ATPase domain-containing protein n=1 Tax=Candidatus Kentrum sp. TC TaxID=2126339 RepID=A0A450ZV13_9GAMM|nr:MAG: AAA ATPase domain-containing protein [Candidatus Kentron sp. TC]
MKLRDKLKKMVRVEGITVFGVRLGFPSPESETPPPQRLSPIAAPDPAAAPLLPHGEAQLRTYGDGFAGRERELEALDAAWARGRARVFVLHAEGGAGKTRILVAWLNRLRDAGWRGAGGVFAHSFYSQGNDQRRGASSEVFFRQALRYFGDLAEEEIAALTDPAEKARALAAAILRRRGLLILDGIEPLQYPPGVNRGQFKDPALAHLLLSLAGAGTGTKALCVVTSRQLVTELAPREGEAVARHPLDRLDAEAGCALLRDLGARGGEDELREAVEEYRGHAYSLMLLGSYLRDATDDRDIRRRREIPLLAEDRAGHGGHVQRIFRAYVAHFGEGSPETALLRLMGFFDRPAERELLAVPRDADLFPSLAPEQLQRTLNRLQGLRLIAWDGRGPIDAHPLLRQWFGAELREKSPAAWREGHRLLFEHFARTTPYRPDTLEGLEPLYRAVSHGCAAGLHEKALVDVYRDRILRGAGDDGFYSTFKLGAIGMDLAAVENFFVQPGWKPAPDLAESDRAWLLNEAAMHLRALGRLAEALGPLRAGLEMAIEREDWENAARAANNLSQLRLTLGAVEQAVASAARSVEYADKSGDLFQRMARRTTHADALHQAGERQRARELFAAAETLQREWQPQYPRLYFVQGFRYADLLLAGIDGGAERAAWRAWLDQLGWIRPKAASQGHAGRMRPAPPPFDARARIADCQAVTARAEETLEWMKNASNASLLDIALDRLTLARAGLYGGLLAGQEADAAIEDHANAAVAGLRKAGTMDHLPRGLLTRAWARAARGDGEGARADLDEAWEIAASGPMPLFQADIRLARARLFGRADDYPWESARADLDEARRLIGEHGYHCRDGELADAQAMLP